jgi:hypothetical protein
MTALIVFNRSFTQPLAAIFVVHGYSSETALGIAATPTSCGPELS